MKYILIIIYGLLSFMLGFFIGVAAQSTFAGPDVHVVGVSASVVKCGELDANCDGEVNIQDASIFLWKAKEILPVSNESKLYEYVPEFYDETTTVTFVTDPARKVAAITDFSEEHGTFPVAVAQWDGEGNCTIYVSEPVGPELQRREAEIFGHEVLHCIRGNYHPEGVKK